MEPVKSEPLKTTPDTEHLPVSEVVAILVKRMESNPDEFKRGQWTQIINDVKPFMNRREKQLLNVAMREMVMQRALESAMAKLLTKK